jgi:para-aminobenzoate synthetase component 1
MNMNNMERMNALGKKRIPFLFIIDYQQQHPVILPLDSIKPEEILYSINDVTNVSDSKKPAKQLDFSFKPVDFKRYKKAFNLVQGHILHGNSFLLNLTMPSEVECNYTLKELYTASQAKYKLWFKDQFVVYSPEIFIQIKGRKISSLADRTLERCSSSAYR